MNQTMQKHVRIVSTMLIIFGILYLLAAAGLGLIGLWAIKSQAPAEVADTVPAIISGTVFFLPLGVIGILHILAGRAFRIGVKWSRITLWILSIINLGNVPIGTAVGGYTIWVLINTREEVRNISN